MTYYVNVSAETNGNGTKERPFKSIKEAAAVARPGDTVMVAPGIYRETVKPMISGREDAPITYRSEIPLGAVITGAESVKGWVRVPGHEKLWSVKINNSVFGKYNPYTTGIGGDWYFGPLVNHAGQVYLNGESLYEVSSLEDCEKGDVYPLSWEPEKSMRKWMCAQEDDTTILYANFQGADPNAENVEINVRRNCFMPSENGINYITVSGFEIRQAATTWAPPAAYQDGMIGPHWSKGWIIENCEIHDSRSCGISLGKYYDEENDHYFTTKQVKSATQMERDAVCRGQYHGWTKETIGSHIVRGCHIHHCGQAGIVGRMGCAFSLIEDNHIHHCNTSGELIGAEVGGIKFHAAIDVVFRRNHIHHNTMGIWCDWEAQGTRITQNLLHDHQRPADQPSGTTMMSQDLFIEVSHGPTLIDNNILLSKASLRLPTQGVAVVHNLILGAITCIGTGTAFDFKGNREERYTPYHIRHRTEVAGFATILHGDVRFYNNIFVQHWPVQESDAKKEMGFAMDNNQVAGTSVFDDYPTYDEWIKNFDFSVPGSMFRISQIHFEHLPVWIDGNAYLAGAKPWCKEQSYFINESDQVTTTIEQDERGWHISTNIYNMIQDFSDSLVNTEVLGKAFEPEQFFENPDGTPILFDEDYFGDHRGVSTMPGPFASSESVSRVLTMF